MQNQPSRVGATFHPSSLPLRAPGCGQTAERQAGFKGSAWRERRYSLPLEDQSWEASAPDFQRRGQIRGRGRVSGGIGGGYRRHLSPLVLRQPTGGTGEESLACRDVQAPQVKSIFYDASVEITVFRCTFLRCLMKKLMRCVRLNFKAHADNAFLVVRLAPGRG